MPEKCEYRFRIDALTPDTLPMARLAEYMSGLAAMLGEQDRVHFVRLEEGSTVLVQEIEDDAAHQVRERIDSVSRGDGPPDAMKAFHQTNSRLRADNAVGVLSGDGEAEIIRFPGREWKEPAVFGPFGQEGSLDGRVIMVGGKSDPVPVHIQQGQTVYNCHASRDIASALGRYLFQYELRVWGTGRWTREAEGTWALNHFTIKGFDVLDDAPLGAVVAGLREVPGSGWGNVSDPWSELAEIRQNDDETH